MRSVIKVLDKLLLIFEQLFVVLTSALLALMLLINSINIFLRTVFDFSFPWVWPWTMTLFVWFIFLTFFLLYRQRKDVSVSILLKLLPANLQRLLGIFVYLLIAVVSFLLLTQVPSLMGRQAGVIEIVNLPRYILAAPLLASLTLINLEAIRNLLGLVSGHTQYKPFGEVELHS
jgi:TRAP-type C4-dicarboxylate transport system permease small subunit